MADKPFEYVLHGGDPFEYTLLYFGERGTAPMFDGPAEEVPLPEMPCIHCDENFIDGDRGYYYPDAQPTHHECAFRAVVGGLNHLRGTCSCCGGPDPPDPPDVSHREAAQLAWDWVLENGLPQR